MSKHSICPQNRSKFVRSNVTLAEEKSTQESSAVNSNDFQFVFTDVFCVCESKNLDYFVTTVKIGQLQAHKNSK